MNIVEAPQATHVNARLEAVVRDLVLALKGVVREHLLTEDELHRAAAFLDRVGAAAGFAELFDIGLAMTSLESHARLTGGTLPSLEGPFYAAGAPFRDDGNLLEHEPGRSAEFLTLTGTVTAYPSGEKLSGVEIDVWQADEFGIYDNTGFYLRGKVKTDSEGRYQVSTIVPYQYKVRDDGPNGELLRALGMHSFRPAHIHIKVRVRDDLRLTTQFFFAGFEYLESDVASCVRDELIVQLKEEDKQNGRAAFSASFDIALPSDAA